MPIAFEFKCLFDFPCGVTFNRKRFCRKGFLSEEICFLKILRNFNLQRVLIFFVCLKNKLNKSKAFIEEEDDSEKMQKSNEILKEQELSLYWNYTQSMLRGCGCLPLDRIHTWLKMYANPDLTIEQVKYLIEIKTKEQLLKYNAGQYRLNK
jgi:hypothetical protein